MADLLVAVLAGVSFHEGAAARLKEIGSGGPLILEADPSNKYDSKAIRVLALWHMQAVQVGHIGRSDKAPSGLVGTLEFHGARATWHTARLIINDAGHFRVAIEKVPYDGSTHSLPDRNDARAA